MDVDISNIGSMNINFVKYQSRGTFGQVSAVQFCLCVITFNINIEPGDSSQLWIVIIQLDLEKGTISATQGWGQI